MNRTPQIDPKVINVAIRGSIIKTNFHVPTIIELKLNINPTKPNINEKDNMWLWVVINRSETGLG